MIGYLDRTYVEGFMNRTFPEISDAVFAGYISAAETYINNYLGYNSQTTLSGMMSENIVLEKSEGKVDAFNNVVVNLRKPPLHFDVYNNPIVTQLRFGIGAVKVDLNLNPLNNNLSVLEVAENRRTVVYPSLYFLPAISTVTPTAKMNLFSLASVKFWMEISYTGGYDTLPDDVKLAAAYVVSDILLFRDNPNFLQSFSQGSLSQSFGGRTSDTKGFKVGKGMQMAQALLQPYCRVTW